MSAPVIAFETAVAAWTPDDKIVIALIDGSFAGTGAACVAIVTCRKASAETLVATLCSALDRPVPQGVA